MERRLILFSTTIFFLGLFILLLLPPRDPDLGWQLRCGADLWQLHRLCNINHHTVLMPNYNWPSHYWLYQAILYPAFIHLGPWGLTIIASFTLTAALFFFFRTQPFLLAPITTIILYLLSSSVFSLGIRSQIVSFLFYAILLYLFRNKPSAKTYWLGLGIIWCWTQVHGSFVIGVLFLLSKFTSDFLSFNHRLTKATPNKSALGITKTSPPVPTKASPLQFRYPPERSAGGRLIRSWFIPLLLLFPLTLLNPNGFAVYQEAWRHFSTVKLNLLIAEWVPPTSPYIVGILTLLLIVIISSLRSFSKISIPLIIFNLGIAYLGLKARRFVPFSIVTLLYYSIKQNSKLFSLDTTINRHPVINFLLFLFCFIPLILGLVFRLPYTIAINRSLAGKCLKQNADSPCGAIEYLRNQPDRSPVFNRYEWGGLLDWELPDFLFFVDGRMPAWQTPSGKSPYTIYLEILQTQPGWGKTLETYNIGWLLISPGTFMDLLLQPDPKKYGYEEKYRDTVSVIYRRLPV